MRNKKLKLALLTVLPAILFWLAWPPRDLFFISFVAFVPLFMLEKETKGIKYGAWLIYLSLLLWNAAISWWVWNAEATSSVVMMTANAALMYLPWLGYRKAKKTLSQSRAFLVFISLWLAYEYLHLNWQITWPWFTLGNIFAKHNEVVQWYEITGTMGGSLWVLMANTLIYSTLNQDLKGGKWIKPALVIIIPMVISIPFYFMAYEDATIDPNSEHETLLVQPNVHPYLKFDESTKMSNLKKMLAMTEKKVTPNTKFVILPETAVVEYIDEDHPFQYESIQILGKFVKDHPQIHLVTGISTYNFYDKGEAIAESARKTESGLYYESYNTALMINGKGEIETYHKSKLVPGAEKMPYPFLFSFLEYFALDFGGITGSLGTDPFPTVFGAEEKPDLAPLICYESVFPGHVAQFTRQGAEILLVITNDGWWKDTDGYKQHMYYGCLRAIENRREVLRSANTGITCRINALGQVQERTEWWEPTVLKVNALKHTKLTFYSQYGDYIGRLASFLGVFFALGMFVKGRSKIGNI
jgi:apolipoprotein N-acyltransferase